MEFTDDQTGNDQKDQNGWSLVFHPDLFRKSNLSDKRSNYSFFHYDSNEALHVSDQERVSIENLLEKIAMEYGQSPDRHSQNLIISNIELFLDYCLRFYDRQFFSRTNLNNDTISKFERFLIQYYQSDQALDKGVPTVESCARALHLSPNYLSDLLKKETGKTTCSTLPLVLLK